MKTALTICSILFSYWSCSQAILNDNTEEKIVTLHSSLIDYEIYQGRTVALTRDNSEYFIYYTDPSGAGLFETIDIFFATDLEIDKSGRLYVLGVDSAYQISIGHTVEKIVSYGLSTYRQLTSKDEIYLDETIARASWGGLIFEWRDEIEHDQNRLIALYQFGEDVDYNKTSTYAPRTRNDGASLDQKLVIDRNTNIENDIVTTQTFNNGMILKTPPRRVVAYNPDELSAYRVNDTVWLINETNYELSRYSQFGKQIKAVLISPYPYKSRVLQDASTEKIYFLRSSKGITTVQILDQNGKLTSIAGIRKGISKSDLKISNGYLYYRDSKGRGESIKRVKLD